VPRAPLVRLHNASVSLGGVRVLHGLTWSLRRGQHWAVLGANGSGKSTFLRLVRGELWPDAVDGGSRVYAFDGRQQASPVGLRERIALISPELQERYLQQDWSLTVEQVVASGFALTDYMHHKLDSTQRDFVDELLNRFGIAGLRRRDVRQLSQGELRRALIARALANQPRVLVLDEFCDGLDAVSRRGLLERLNSFAKLGVQFLYTTHRPGELLRCITHVLVLENGRIAWQGPREELPVREGRSTTGRGFRVANSRNSSLSKNRSAGLRTRRVSGGEPGRAGSETGAPVPCFMAPMRVHAWMSKLPTNMGSDVHPSPALRAPSPLLGGGERDGVRGGRAAKRSGDVENSAASSPSPFLFRLRNVSVFLDRKPVLRDLHWQMNADENWVVLGRNGAGKSTFLKLLAGEVHPALGGNVQRFGAESRHTLWQVRRRIGQVSSDFQAAYRDDITGELAIASGFFGSIGLLRRRPTAEQMQVVRALVKRFDLGGFASQSVQRMSYGQLRRILLARALVHDPAVLLLDEPFDGLDLDSKLALQSALDDLSRNGTRLLIVTHHLEDLPRCITHAAVLDAGQLTAHGPLNDSQFHRWAALAL